MNKTVVIIGGILLSPLIIIVTPFLFVGYCCSQFLAWLFPDD